MNKSSLLLICAYILHCVKADCTLHLNKDFATPSPVFLVKNKYMVPNGPAGTITLNRTERVVIACPGKGKNVITGPATNSEVVVASCIRNSTFKIKNSPQFTNFSEIKCSNMPWFVTEEQQGNCYRGHGEYKSYRVGYVISETFKKLYEICFNQDLLHTAYAKHTVIPETAVIQTGIRRPTFIEGTLFGKVKVGNVYKLNHQKARFNTLLGEGSAELYLDKHFLTRGHLAPRADFPLNAMQRASFHYANAAPQWMKGNAGDWAALEDAIRRKASTLLRPLTVYTGTYGVSTLPHKDTGKQVDLYLDVDSNNNNVIPVPLYFFKLVYDEATKTATAFVSVNSPFYSTAILDDLTFCNDICSGPNKLSWLRWRANDYTHSFCCSYDEFVKTIDVLPKLHVGGLFI